MVPHVTCFVAYQTYIIQLYVSTKYELVYMIHV
jgi:hypothetical protein